jgi:hypothetical protein
METNPASETLYSLEYRTGDHVQSSGVHYCQISLEMTCIFRGFMIQALCYRCEELMFGRQISYFISIICFLIRLSYTFIVTA